MKYAGFDTENHWCWYNVCINDLERENKHWAYNCHAASSSYCYPDSYVAAAPVAARLNWAVKVELKEKHWSTSSNYQTGSRWWLPPDKTGPWNITPLFFIFHILSLCYHDWTTLSPPSLNMEMEYNNHSYVSSCAKSILSHEKFANSKFDKCRAQ